MEAGTGVSERMRWGPAIILGIGCVLALASGTGQRSLPLRMPLAHAVPAMLQGYGSRDLTLPAEEKREAAVSSYLLRSYGDDGGRATAFTLYVGYYEQQKPGQMIHSPKDCLPGAGWQPLTSGSSRISTDLGTVDVNRYLIARASSQALVLYWYQGRGRVDASEFRARWDLLKDSALRHRSDEALVRIIVPVRGSEDEAYRLAKRIAQDVIPFVQRALPS